MKKKFLTLFLAIAMVIPSPFIIHASEINEEARESESTIIFDTDSKTLLYYQPVIANDSLGKPSIILMFDYINKTSIPKSPMIDFFPSASQNGTSLLTTTIIGTDLSPYFANAYNQVKDNETLTFCLAYILSDTSDIELKINDSIAGGNTQKITFSVNDVISATEKIVQETKDNAVKESQSNIDKFIECYNLSCKNQITDIQDMDIQGLDYRTEYRLNAFKNAVGKKGIVNDSTIQIVNYGYPINDHIRIYFDTPSYDTVIDTCTKIINIFDKTISEQAINQIYDTMNSVGSDSILLNNISGYISNKHSNGEISGYTLMLDCSNLSFLE